MFVNGACVEICSHCENRVRTLSHSLFDLHTTQCYGFAYWEHSGNGLAKNIVSFEREENRATVNVIGSISRPFLLLEQ